MLKISEQLSLPLDAITSTFAIMAMRGVGKTSLASVMAEEMLKAGQPIVAYDPTGAWFGLKSSADGKRSGFPVVIFGGEHADVPLEELAGETIARVIVERRIPAVLDVSLMRKGARIRFMMAFCEALYHLNREPLHLFLDEAHTVAPKDVGKFGERGVEPNRLLGAVEDIVLQGRRKGLGITVISQRPALVNANVRTQCATLMAMRLMAKLDITAVKEWIEAHASVEEAKEMLGSIATLNIGEGWVWSPSYLKIFKRVQFRRRETFDSSATPQIGKRVVTPKVVAEIDLAALGEEIKATVEKAKADDPKELRRRIAALEKQLAQRPTEQVEKTVEKIVEVPVLKNSQLDRTEKIAERLQAQADKFLAETQELRRLIGAAVAPRQAPQRQAVQSKPIARAPAPARQPPKPKSEPSGDLGKCERAILAVLAQHPDGCNMGKLALLTGYRASGGFRNNLGALRSLGFIDGSNTGVMQITEAGRESGEFEDLPTGRDLALYWLNHPSFSKCEREVLRALLENPAGLTMDQVAELSGYQASGGFRNALGALRTAGVIVGRNVDVMRAHEDLLA